MGYNKGEDRDQITMLPMCIDDFVSEENPVRVIDAFVESLGLRELGFAKSVPALTGRPAYDPKDLLKLYCYGYRHGVRSSRRLEVETYRNVEVMWLLRSLKPDHKTIADFRRENRAAIKNVFREFALLCRAWGLLGAELVAVDGTKIKASNSRRANLSPKKLEKKIEYTDERINEYLGQLDKNDDCETANDPKLTKEEIQRRIAQLKERKTGYEQLKQEMTGQGVSEMSLTDPDSRRMSANNNGIDIAHNVQIAVDSLHSLVVDCEVTSNTTDHGHLSIMAESAKTLMGVDKIEALADKGYYAAADLVKCDEAKVTTYVPKQKTTNHTGLYLADMFEYHPDTDTYTCPGKQILKAGRLREEETLRDYRNRKACKNCELRDRCTTSQNGRIITRNLAKPLLDQVEERTEANKDKYRLRQLIVEHPFGTIKRNFGFTYFLTRGNAAVRAEASLAFLMYNMIRAIKILGFKNIMGKLATV